MHTASRTHSFTESVIRGMTRLASQHGALNLAQGFPDFPAPEVLKAADHGFGERVGAGGGFHRAELRRGEASREGGGGKHPCQSLSRAS